MQEPEEQKFYKHSYWDHSNTYSQNQHLHG